MTKYEAMLIKSLGDTEMYLGFATICVGILTLLLVNPFVGSIVTSLGVASFWRGMHLADKVATPVNIDNLK
jgi:hypothetical protein